MLRILTACALLFALAPVARADDARDRNARAALALAGAARPATAATAPAPRVAVTKDYSAGCKDARARELPLVVFVGCPGRPVPGAVVAKADELGDTKGPAVVVGFPAGEKMFIHATLECPATDGELGAAVKAATKKVGDPAPREKAAPKPLNWDVRADDKVGSCVGFSETLAKELGLLDAQGNRRQLPEGEEAAIIKAALAQAGSGGQGSLDDLPSPSRIVSDAPKGCRCGEARPCGAAKAEAKPAPAKAPVASQDLHISPDGTVNARGADGIYRAVPGAAKQAPPAYLPAYPFPATASGCPGGTCAPATQYTFPAAPACPNGQCPQRR